MSSTDRTVQKIFAYTADLVVSLTSSLSQKDGRSHGTFARFLHAEREQVFFTQTSVLMPLVTTQHSGVETCITTTYKKEGPYGDKRQL